MTYALTTTSAWPAGIVGHDIHVRALSLDEVRAAREEAARRCPPDLYGERLYVQVVGESHARLTEAFEAAQEAARVADDLLGQVASGEPVEAEASRALDLLRKAHALLATEAKLGRLRKFAALRADDVDRAALDRFEAHIAAPYVEQAVRGVVRWGGVAMTPEATRAQLDTIADDPTGAAGRMLAMDIVSAMSRGALDERGKGRSARRDSSRAQVSTGKGNGRKAGGTATAANGRRGSAR